MATLLMLALVSMEWALAVGGCISTDRHGLCVLGSDIPSWPVFEATEDDPDAMSDKMYTKLCICLDKLLQERSGPRGSHLEPRRPSRRRRGAGPACVAQVLDFVEEDDAPERVNMRQCTAEAAEGNCPLRALAPAVANPVIIPVPGLPPGPLQRPRATGAVPAGRPVSLITDEMRRQSWLAAAEARRRAVELADGRGLFGPVIQLVSKRRVLCKG